MRYRKIKAKFIEAKIYTEVLHNKRIHNSSKKKKLIKLIFRLLKIAPLISNHPFISQIPHQTCPKSAHHR